MYCKKCGKELKAGERFCPQCGTKNGGTAVSVNLGGFGNIGERLNRIGSGKKWYLANLVLLVVSLFLIDLPMFEATYTIFQTYSVDITLFEKMDAVKVIFILGYLVAILAITLPLPLNKDLKESYFLMGKWLSLISLILLFCVFFSAKEIVMSGEYGQL